jgi:hypothetical protein
MPPFLQRLGRYFLEFNPASASPFSEMTGPEDSSRSSYVTAYTRVAEIRELYGREPTGKRICLSPASF